MLQIADYEELDTLNAVFDRLIDPRIERHKKYPLKEIMLLALIAALSGVDSWRGIELFGKVRLGLLRKYMPFQHEIPSFQTISRVFSLIKPRYFEAAFLACMEKISKRYANEIIAMDGKTIRRSYDKSKAISAIQLVNAWSVDQGLVLAQRAVPANGNEIETVRELLEILDVRGATITIDAMHCQKGTLEKVLRNGADYMVSLKRNQQSLHDQVEQYFSQEPLPYDEPHFYETYDKGHGRIEHRRYFCHEVGGWLEKSKEFLGISSVGMVLSEVTKDGMTRSETRFYVMSFSADAKRFAACCRGHWSIENGLHWVLDVVFEEDKSLKRKDHAPRNFSLLRKFAMNILKRDKTTKHGPKHKRLLMMADPSYLELALELSGF